MSGIRSEVQWFATEMEKQLKANDHKGGWKDCDPWDLLNRADEELMELRDAVFKGEHGGGADRIIHEAADVANFCMMIADIARLKGASS